MGTAYGNEVIFTTNAPPTVPVVTTTAVSSYTSTLAISGGDVTSNGGANVTARGVCWSTSINPVITGNHTTDGTGTGTFFSSITGFSPNTTYYLRAYATNIAGTAYGNQIYYTTPSSTPNYPPGYVHCNPSSPTAIVDVFNPTTGRLWMNRNLGAAQVAISATDSNAYGDLFQWGRFADGHQCRTSATTTTLSASDQAGHGNFIVSNSSPYDWRSPQNASLWQEVNGVNNPCPIGYSLPTEAEWYAERLSWSSNNTAGAFASPLKLSLAGYRNLGGIIDYGTIGDYWSSTVSSTKSKGIEFVSNLTQHININRAMGSSVRCIKDTIISPLLSTDSVYGITGTSASIGINIISNGGAAVTARGVCWSTTPSPTLANNTTTSGLGNGVFYSYITGLSPSTTYYVRAYATNSSGTGYGNQKAFTTGITPTYPAGYIHCNPSSPTTIVDVFNPTTGRLWMDRNLGAAQVATSSTDTNAYGDLYQWGRLADGHQCRTSATTTTISSSDQPGHGNFIATQYSPDDWRSPQNTNLWQGVNGINNPCPTGFRVPTEAELNAERLSWSSNNAAGAFASPLKLPLAGYRSNNGSVICVGSIGFYWTSTVNSTASTRLIFSNNPAVFSYTACRAWGSSVRCIKD